jgi:hypothetical protein
MAEELSIFNSLDNFRTESGLKSTHQLRARLCAFINFLNKSMSVKMKTLYSLSISDCYLCYNFDKNHNNISGEMYY